MKTKLVSVALLLLGHNAMAVEVPTAGSQLQQIPTPAAPEKPAPQLRIETDTTSLQDSGDETTIVVNRLHIVNARAFTEAELIDITGFKPGAQQSLTGLRRLAAKIADYYHSRGYFLTQAHLPAQDVKDGEVTIAVVEGEYGKVVVRNQSNLSDSVANRLLSGLGSGDTITIAPLESRLLQLADLPGVNVRSTLVPGASVGAADLIVDVTPGRRFSGSVDADNAGSRYTGANRVGGTLNVNDPFGRGDVATLRVLTSFDGLDYGRAAYQLQFGRMDAGVAYTALDYELGREFDSLHAHGTAQIASVYGRYPLLRSRSSNLYAQLDLDDKTFHDKLDVNVSPTITNKKAQVAMLSLVGDHRDSWGGGGLNSFSLTWTSGSLDLQSAAALTTDEQTARTNGHYDKLGFSAMRLQRVTDSFSLYAALQGQFATGNLDVSEKIGLGGADAVRAYPEGEAYADQAWLLNVEARMPITRFSPAVPGQLQWVVFVDSGTGRLNKNPWDDSNNRRTLSGAGLGLNWFDNGNYSVKAYYAHKLGAAVATSAPDADSRFWISAVKYF